MNEEIILSMAKPYIKEGIITYDDFERLFSFLSLREQYAITDVLDKNGIILLDKHIEEEGLILDVNADDDDNELYDSEFHILYDESIFQDNNEQNSGFDSLVVHKTIKQSNEILCSLIQQGNRQAVQDLCVKNKPLVDKYVIAYDKRYGNRLDFEDLEQVGFIGLIKAAQKFNIQQGTAFSTYAVFWIKQSISREIMDNGYAIRIPVHMMEKISKVVAIENRLLETGMSFHERTQYIAEELGLSEDIVCECLILKKNYMSYSSLDIRIGDNGDSELGEFIIDKTAQSTEAVVIGKALREELSIIMKQLKPRDRRIIELRFGWNDGRPRTLEEIGKEFGVTRERIRQIESKTLQKLSNTKGAKRLRAFLED